MTFRITLHSTARTGTNEGRLTASIAAALGPELEVQIARHRVGLLSLLRRSDALVIHSPLGFSVGAIFLAKLLRRPVIAFVWDLYPVRIHGRRYSRRLRRLVADTIERLALRMSDQLIVQTRDFLTSPILARAQVIPFWYVPSVFVTRGERDMTASGAVKFAFAGQINETRGLSETVASLDAILNKKAILNIYSRDYFEPPVGMRNLTVHHRGHLSKDQLAQSLRQDDIGIVSLHPGFNGPAFPSKSLDYLAAGLSIAYFGPVLEHYEALLERTCCGVAAGGGHSLDFDQLLALQNTSQHCTNSFFDQVRADPTRLKCHFVDIINRHKEPSSAGSSRALTDNTLDK